MTLLLTIIAGASLAPELIDGDISTAIFKLCIAIGSLLMSSFMGAINGIKGGRIKLSIVEDTCSDLERWAHKKPIIAPYIEPYLEKPSITSLVKTDLNFEENDQVITEDIFKTKSQ